MNILIKRAAPEDAPAISRIYAASWRTAYRGMVPQKYLDELQDDYWVTKFQNWITNNSLQVDLLYADNTPAGCVAYGKARDEQLTGWGEIVSIYVHPDYYRQGYGAKLLNSTLKNLKAMEYQNCYLWAFSDNWNARKFYEANGFKVTQDSCYSEIMGKQLAETRYKYYF